MTFFHGFYYGSCEGVLTKLPASKAVMRAVETGIMPKMADVRPEEYWKRYAVGMLNHAPQGYIAFEGASIWIRNADQIFAVEFTHRRIRACTFTPPESEGDRDDPYDEMTQTPWDWLLEENCAGKKCSKKERQQIDRNVDWTERLHEKLHAIEPLEQLAKSEQD